MADNFISRSATGTGSAAAVYTVPTANLTMGFKTYPSDTGSTISRDVTTSTRFFDLRGRGRQTNVKITSDTLGSDWRYGTLRLDIKPDGGR